MRLAPTTLALCVLAAGSVGCDARAPRHNVLLITLDTTRADHLGCYRGSAVTPNIDALAAEGALFSRAISTAGLTPMSHASILSGLNNYRHGLRVFYSERASNQLDPRIETLPEILGAHGWKTAAFVSAYPVSGVYGLDQGFDEFDEGSDTEELDPRLRHRHETLWFEGQESSTQRRGDRTMTRALEWLETTGPTDPWCLWVHLFDAHDFSIVPDGEWIARFDIEYDKDVRFTDVDWRERMYDPEIAFMDEQLGRLFDHLRATGQWDETIVVVTADHGQGLKDGLERHGWLKHRLLYDWSLHVPLIVRVPGQRAGAVVEPLVRTIDVLPTLLEALDLPGPAMEGESLLGLLYGDAESSRLAYADALNEFDDHAPVKYLREEYRDNLFCVVDQRWKLIWHQHEEGNVELYDLEQDPQELENVAAQYPEQVARLRRFLEERRAMHVEGTSTATDEGKLDELGYTAGDEER